MSILKDLRNGSYPVFPMKNDGATKSAFLPKETSSSPDNGNKHQVKDFTRIDQTVRDVTNLTNNRQSEKTQVSAKHVADANKNVVNNNEASQQSVQEVNRQQIIKQSTENAIKTNASGTDKKGGQGAAS